MGDSTDAGVKMDFETWINKRRFKYSDFTYEQLSEAIRTTNAVVTVIIPGKEVADSIGGVLDVTVAPLVEAGIVKNVVVIDAASADGTGEVAAKHGARVVQRKDIATELGPSLGKGDALWRALQVTDGDIIAFLDGDTGDPNPAHLMGIIAPLILDQEIQMVRACFDRPFKGTNGETKPHEGGRVTEILARPLLNLYCPDLRGFRQPLAGEFAARRDLLEKFTFPVGYGIEIGTFIDAYTIMGLGALAEVDVGTRQNAHKPLRELPKMGMGILGAFDRRTTGGAHVDGSNLFLPWDNASVHIPTKERPTIKQYRTQIEQRANTMSEMEFSVFPSPPFVNIEGVRMFRDIGGNIIDSTHKVRSGLFYRSGQLEGMSAKGAEGFRKLGLKVIFDMRSPIEINTPSIHGTDGSEKRHDSGIEVSGLSLATLLLEPGAPEVVLVPAFPDEDWKQENKQERLKNYANAAEGYARAYKHTLVRGASAYKPILQHLAQPSPTPILVHCSAGKDRTGLAAMLVLLLAGCSPDVVAKEYALNNLDSKAEWGVGATKRLLNQPGLAGNVGAVANVVEAREEYALETIKGIEQEWGSVQGYVKDVLGLTEGEIQQIKENLVVSTEG